MQIGQVDNTRTAETGWEKGAVLSRPNRGLLRCPTPRRSRHTPRIVSLGTDDQGQRKSGNRRLQCKAQAELQVKGSPSFAHQALAAALPHYYPSPPKPVLGTTALNHICLPDTNPVHTVPPPPAARERICPSGVRRGSSKRASQTWRDTT